MLIVNIQNKAKWLFYQLGQLVLAAGLLSLVFNYGYRYTVDRNINTPGFYLATVALGLIVFLLARKDYVFVNRYAFSEAEIEVGTLLGVKKRYPTSEYAFVPALHKAVNVPEQKATLSFYVRDLKKGRNVRNYSWVGVFGRGFPGGVAAVWLSGGYGFQAEGFWKAWGLRGCVPWNGPILRLAPCAGGKRTQDADVAWATVIGMLGKGGRIDEKHIL